MKGNEGDTIEGDLEAIVITDEWKPTIYYIFGLTKYQKPKYRGFSPEVAELYNRKSVLTISSLSCLFLPPSDRNIST